MALVKSEVKIMLFLGLALLFCGAHGSRLVNNHLAVFDVTKFGAKAGGKYDCNTAFIRAWIAACHTPGHAKVVIPPGNFMTGEVLWSGPCLGHVTVEVQGTVTANKDISEYPNGVWFSVENVDGFTIDGANFKGSFHGSGQTSWKYDTCKSGQSCDYPPLPPSFSFNGVKHADVGFLSSIDSRGYHFKIIDSSDVNLHNLNIRAPSTSPHTNGAYIVSSHNVGVTKSSINTGGGKACVIWGHGNTNTIYNQVSCNTGH